MLLSKEIRKQLRKFTDNRECTQVEMAEFCGVTQPSISRTLKYGECSEAVYQSLLKFIEKVNIEIAEREKIEAKLLKPVA